MTTAAVTEQACCYSIHAQCTANDLLTNAFVLFAQQNNLSVKLP